MIYLGLDSSTQSVTATAIEVDAGGRRTILFERSFRYDDVEKLCNRRVKTSKRTIVRVVSTTARCCDPRARWDPTRGQRVRRCFRARGCAAS